MPPLAPMRVAVIGVLCVAAACLLGYPYSLIGQILTAVFAAVCIAFGVRVYKPKSLGPWICFGTASLTFLISYTLRLFLPELQTLPSEAPTICDVMDALAFGLTIAGAHRLGRPRLQHRDPTTVIDSLIFTVGIGAIVWIAVLMPYVTSDQHAPAAKLLNVAVSTLSLWLVFVVSRVAIGPARRTAAFKPLALAAFFGMASTVAASASGGAVGTFALFFGSISLLCLAIAPLSPSMTAVTHQSTQSIARMSTGRLMAMGAAAIIAPVMLFSHLFSTRDSLTFYAGLIASWVIVTGLVMLRVAGLVRARERVASTERALRKASARLVTAASADETYQAALSAMFEVAASAEGLRASFALAGESSWRIVASQGIGSAEALGRSVDALFMTAMTESTGGSSVQLDDSLPLDAPRSGASCTLVVPIKSRNLLRGAMLLSSVTALPAYVVEAIESLASDVALAIEAIGLAEDLHRRRSEQRFQAMIQLSKDLTAILDNEGRISYVSPAAETILAVSVDDLLGKRLASFAHPEDQSVIDELVSLFGTTRESHRAEIRLGRTPTGWKTLELVVNDLRSEESIQGIVLNAHDITDRKALEEDLRHKVLHDDLTGIANRVLFRERVEHALTSRNRADSVTAVLHLNLDDFQTVNDGLGHDVGDELLKVIAFRLGAFLRAGDTAARLGGDEFAVLLENLYTDEDVINACHRLMDVVREPVQFGSRSVNITGSIGVALATEGTTSDLIMRNADVALHHAKAAGKSALHVFDEQMYATAFERLELRGDLQHALERQELLLHFQPLVGMQTGELLGFEALLRWIHPTRGFVGPDAFIPIAEETGLILPIGQWVVESALAQLARWQIAYPAARLAMSVNVSPRQLESDDIVKVVRRQIEDNNLDPSLITLELTESSGLDDDDCRNRLVALRDLGCEIAADDFGTGFASYAALQELPFTNVKIDRSLVNGVSGENERAHAQVKSIIDMGHSTGLSVTAEGIEDATQRDRLIAMGADKGQGYYFGRPASAKDAATWVEKCAGGETVFPMEDSTKQIS